MPQTFNEWLSLYTAVITTGLLVAIIVILWKIVKSKNATIELLKERVEFWKEQNVSVVHQINEALRKEMKELAKNHKNSNEDIKKKVEEINELKTTILQLRDRTENQTKVSRFNTYVPLEFRTPTPPSLPRITLGDGKNIVLQYPSEKELEKQLAEGEKAIDEFYRVLISGDS